MNGLNRSPSASSNDRPGGLAQASHAAASMAAMDGTTRAVKVEDMGGQAVRSGASGILEHVAFGRNQSAGRLAAFTFACRLAFDGLWPKQLWKARQRWLGLA